MLIRVHPWFPIPFRIPAVVTILCLLLLIAARASGMEAEMPVDPDNDFSPMLGMFALVAICVMIALIGAGIVVTAIAAASIAVLVALGITSSAVLVGIFTKRLSSGLRAFHYQICAVAAIPAGIGALGMANWFAEMGMRLREILLIGSLAGIASGLVLALAADLIVRLLCRRFLEFTGSRQSLETIGKR